MRRTLLSGLFLLLVAPSLAGTPAAELRPPVVGLMRHGGGIVAAPGQPPPVPGCDPQAVLTEEGRAEMRRLGDRFRAEGLTAARIFSSRQCSAWETGVLLGLGPVRHDPALDPVTPTVRDARRRALRRSLLEAGEAGGPVLLITHRANISDLTGIELVQGEVLLLRAEAGRLVMAGQITSD